MKILLWCLGILILIPVGLALMNLFFWALFTFFPWAVLGLLIIACIMAAALRPRYWY